MLTKGDNSQSDPTAKIVCGVKVPTIEPYTLALIILYLSEQEEEKKPHFSFAIHRGARKKLGNTSHRGRMPSLKR